MGMSYQNIPSTWTSLWEVESIADLVVAMKASGNPDPYAIQLVFLVLPLFFAAYTQRKVFYGQNIELRPELERMSGKIEDGSSSAASTLGKRYLLVYGLVMGADWLQGPYLYSLYREQYNFAERLVAVLFITGFVSAGVAAPFVGACADQYGRKRLCLAFCVTYAFGCLCKLANFYPLLLFGRVFGGVSTAILFTSFEAWLVSSSTSLSLSQSDLSTIMARATLLNGFVATAAGVISNELVRYTNTFRSPFVLAAIVLACSWIVIELVWTENYGEHDHVSTNNTPQIARLKEALHILFSNSQLLILGLIQTFFEGSMYIFVFNWVPSLEQVSGSSSLPLGYIFSSFMMSMMLGSLFYTFIVNRYLPRPAPCKSVTSPLTPTVETPFLPDSYDFPLPPPSPIPNAQSSPSTIQPAESSSLVLYTRLSSFICFASSLSLLGSILVTNAPGRSIAFCVFEACVGMYYPVQGMLRSVLIPDEHRATISSLFRIPLNIFVVVSLLTGVTSARQVVLVACSAVLGFSSIIMFMNSMRHTRIARQTIA
ncbi:hypothetical protein F5887DRAFT_588509 [Amanita rubescens]|nr:hypothetical protein F5887DRAFT_588509 [Amanita rubescens]